MKKIPGNLLKNLEKSWKYHGILSDQKSGNPVHPQTRYPPGPGTPQGPGTSPGTRYTPGPGAPPGAVHAGRYGQQASGTHPTGMHSC